jgi:hypothetical protein
VGDATLGGYGYAVEAVRNTRSDVILSILGRAEEEGGP